MATREAVEGGEYASSLEYADDHNCYRVGYSSSAEMSMTTTKRETISDERTRFEEKSSA